MSQMSQWLTEDSVQRLVVVVSGVDSGETLERWQFNVQVEDGKAPASVAEKGSNDENVLNATPSPSTSATGGKKNTKTVKEVHDEIQAIIRQITASVSFVKVGEALYWKFVQRMSKVQYMEPTITETNRPLPGERAGDLPPPPERAVLLRPPRLHEQGGGGAQEVGGLGPEVHNEQPGGQAQELHD
ncbi:hypothetical protein THAOC_12310 [Thalassiosira oceanica]|uniref:HORMA domain-containing protein n=1 Tax=Thalassiosira oceanica TaxID=159749 RepID=K0T8G2_THAOC|nr:hypothetical protein THAOC_12310 [Thalassiosira oceanica]|eukprot:EJK66737.1 hypothetical protein THAOC_12310 [Thalassiosira oceanica]